MPKEIKFLTLAKALRLEHFVTVGWVLVALFFLSSCAITQARNNDTQCQSPENFEVSDILGTWETGLPERKDTLIINADGTYKQIIHVESISFDYESDLEHWSIEKSSDNLHYLHLENMRLCIYWNGFECDRTSKEDIGWYDFCKDEWITTPHNIGTFIILETPEGFEETTFKFRLFSLQKSTFGTTVYDYKTE